MRIKAKDDGEPPEWTVPRWMIDEGDPLWQTHTELRPIPTRPRPDDDVDTYSHRADA